MSTSSQKRPREGSVRGIDGKKPRVTSSLPGRRKVSETYPHLHKKEIYLHKGQKKGGVKSPPDFPSTDQFVVEIKLSSTIEAERNDPESEKASMREHWKDLELTPADVQEKENEAEEEMIADVRTQSEGAKNGVEINTTMSSQPQEPERVNFEHIDSGPADNALMGCDQVPSGGFSEDRTDDDCDFEELAENFDDFAEWKWLEPLHGTVAYTRGNTDVTQHNRIGYCVGKLIRRNQIRRDFYHKMEEPTQDTCLLAFELFDRYGCLKPEYKNHPIRKGSGIWRQELDDGDILLIEQIKISEKYQRCGLGSRLVKAMLEKTKKKSRGFTAITWPTVLWTDKLRAEVNDKTETERRIILQPHDDLAKAFWRSLGFRRIGSSNWFALASDKGHPCHYLSAGDDYNPAVPHHDTSKYPPALKAATAASNETECIGKLAQFLHQTPAADPSWFMPDKQGNTLLHIAALHSQPRTVDWIMKNGLGKQMLDTRNDAGDTPLEAILVALEEKRTRRNFGTMTVPRSDKFKGFKNSSVSCIARLKGLTEASQLDLARLTFGCTCGQCIEGFLSPRMTYALLCWAEFRRAMDDEDIIEWFVPEKVQAYLESNESMRQGFINVFKHVAACLRAKVPPTEGNVLAALENADEWPPATKTFLQGGGSVALVATICFKLAMDEDEFAGSGHPAGVPDEIKDLPECRNDHEFGFVSGMCGYERISPTPYLS